MKKLKISIIVFILCISVFVPFNALATDFGSFCSDTVDYPTDDIPAFSSLISSNTALNCLVYNDLDDCFYFVVTNSISNVSIINAQFHVSFYVYPTSRCTVYKYDPSNGNSWVSYKTGSKDFSTLNLDCFGVSSNFPFKFLYCSADFTYTDDTYSYTVTSNQNNVGSSYIYANYFDPSGIYLDNDPNASSSGSGSDSGNVSVNVDFTQTNNILTSIFNKLDTVNTNLVSFKSDVSTKLSTINTSITNGFTGMQTYLTGKFTTLYNILLYGSEQGNQQLVEQEMQLAQLETDFDSINGNVSNVSTLINDAGDDVADYITTFTQFYNGMAAISGLAAILSFGLIIILVKKVIGR